MKTKEKFCAECKKFENKFPEDADIKRIPTHCARFISITDPNIVGDKFPTLCAKKSKIIKFFKRYFPVENLSAELYTLFNQNNISTLTIRQAIPSNEDLVCYSLRIKTCSLQDEPLKLNGTWRAKDEGSKEIWRFKDEKIANIVCEILNKYPYYWIPIETVGELFVERIEL